MKEITLNNMMEIIPKDLWDKPIKDIDGEFNIIKVGYIEDVPYIALKTTFSNLSKTSQEQLKERGII